VVSKQGLTLSKPAMVRLSAKKAAALFWARRSSPFDGAIARRRGGSRQPRRCLPLLVSAVHGCGGQPLLDCFVLKSMSFMSTGVCARRALA
jgi:hypothetical protein